MVVVASLQLWPKGDKTKARGLGTIIIVNDGTGTKDKGNYVIQQVTAGKIPNRWIRLDNYSRNAHAPMYLLYKALKALYEGNPEKGMVPGREIVSQRTIRLRRQNGGTGTVSEKVRPRSNKRVAHRTVEAQQRRTKSPK